MFLTVENGDNFLEVFPNEFTLKFVVRTTLLCYASSSSFCALYNQLQ